MLVWVDALCSGAPQTDKVIGLINPLQKNSNRSEASTVNASTIASNHP